MEHFFEFIRMCDLFAHPVQLNLLNSSCHRSRFSGCFSIFISLFFVLLMYQGLVDLFRREQYNVLNNAKTQMTFNQSL